jgi:hypothetical protein
MLKIPENCPICGSKTQSTNLTPPDEGVAYCCTRCSWPGDVTLIPKSQSTIASTNITTEMIVGSVEKIDDFVKMNRFVKFSTGNGHHILYPWNALKQTVLQ